LNKQDISKVEGKCVKFGKGGGHIILTNKWLGKNVVVITKERWNEIQGILSTIGTSYKI
jgi:hypothetical protein